MNNPERFIRTMTFQPVDHPPLLVSEPWPATRRRWEQEGLPDGADLYDYFSLEPVRLELLGIETLMCPAFEERVIEESAEYVISINRHGVKVRNFRDESSMPQFLEYPVKGPEDLSWLRQRLDPATPGRVKPDWMERAAKAQEEGRILLGNGGEYFAFLNEHMGTEAFLFACVEQPDFVHAVNDLVCRCCERALQAGAAKVRFDMVGYHEDMACKTGPLFSPRMFEEFMTPCYRRVRQCTPAMDARLHVMDSDGDIRKLIPLWMACGISTFLPLEVAAGMDVVELRREYGRDIGLWGGFDKRILAGDAAGIRREMERLRPVIEGGGYLPACDHMVPPDVPLENYRCFVESLKTLYGMR